MHDYDDNEQIVMGNGGLKMEISQIVCASSSTPVPQNWRKLRFIKKSICLFAKRVREEGVVGPGYRLFDIGNRILGRNFI